ncbi:hypothetical protein [Streptomyces winkii]|uniref:hypothetical protein n=1 Tax=Streptomyces winkii TaxID=3051178 RepID=UPI0028D4C214|nr:hypothetical protein [Streptomyces sp. DSM 40971]
MTDDRFANQILSMTTANPGWQVHARVEEFDKKTRERSIQAEFRSPVVAWAVVQRRSSDGELSTAAEPVFLDGGLLVNSSEYRRENSELHPEPGNPEVTASVRVEAPSN